MLDSEKESINASEGSSQPAFEAIDAYTLRTGNATGFDIFASEDIGKAPVVRYLGNVCITEEIRGRLIAEGVPLFVAAKQQTAYERYIEGHLSSIMDDADVPVAEKARLAYSATARLLRHVLEENEMNGSVEKSRRLAADFMRLFKHEKNTLGHFMKIMDNHYGVSTHGVNVFIFSVSLALKAGLGNEAVTRLGQGALFHDIGKRRISEDILNRRGKLTPEQWRVMRRHPEFGADMLTAADVNDTMVLDVTLHHHEKLNGKGYPDGLSGERVSKWARICAIADIFDALTTNRSYSNAASSFDSLNIMIKEMKGELDQELLRIFIKMIGSV